jgi:hypothetical protein
VLLRLISFQYSIYFQRVEGGWHDWSCWTADCRTLLKFSTLCSSCPKLPRIQLYYVCRVSFESSIIISFFCCTPNVDLTWLGPKRQLVPLCCELVEPSPKTAQTKTAHSINSYSRGKSEATGVREWLAALWSGEVSRGPRLCSYSLKLPCSAPRTPLLL